MDPWASRRDFPVEARLLGKPFTKSGSITRDRGSCLKNTTNTDNRGKDNKDNKDNKDMGNRDRGIRTRRRPH
jgi:hypothetical protein